MTYDISPPLSPRLAVWPGDAPLTREVLLQIGVPPVGSKIVSEITLSTLRATVHLGAHADAPSHYGVGAPAIDARDLDYYLGPCQVIRAPVGRGGCVTADAIRGPITTPRVLFDTGTHPDPERFPEDFAALSPELVTWLHHRGVRLVGIDTPSVDPFSSKELPAHKTFLRHDMAILEGLALKDVPEGISELIALPLRLVGFDASPVRAESYGPCREGVVMILPSVRAFFAGIIDYAGLFPPARLPLDRAIGNYAKYRADSDAWMLGRFIIPAARLGELDAFTHHFSSGPPLPVSVLGRGGETVEAFRAGVEADREAVAAFRSRHGAAVAVDAFEVKVPAGAFVGAGDDFRGATEALRAAGMSIFYEVPPDCPLSFLAGMRGGAAGVKLRCGGLDASAFPGPGQVAQVIAGCRDNGLSLKFTAGLHHPLRHFDRDVSAKMHGFLNVFGAGVLTHAAGLGEQQVREIIEDEDPSHFGFDEIGFGWKQYHALTDEIIAARREFVVSFGSCSFDEPRADLRAMGILP